MDDKRDAEAAQAGRESDANVDETNRFPGIKLVNGTIKKKVVDQKNYMKAKKHTKAIIIEDDNDKNPYS